MRDRGTLAIKGRKERMELVLKRISENEGIIEKKLCALLSYELGVSPDKVDEYVRTLGDAGLIIPKNGTIWTTAGLEKADADAKERAFLEEEKIMESARAKGMSPIEGYDRESTV